MAARQRARLAFTALITADEADLDLGRAAFLIAAEEYPALDIDESLSRLDALANQVRFLLDSDEQQELQRPTTSNQGFNLLHALNRVLFEQEHFRGNRIDYYNPQNSFLNRVLERRLGIPLTLSLLYMEVGKRLGLGIEGIGMPFHFIVRCTFAETTIYVDPYEKGKFLTEEDCRKRLTQIFKHQEDVDPHWLEPLPAKQLLHRMLSNLKNIYLHKNDFQRALAVCDRILLLMPDLPLERRDRGVIHFHLKFYARALRDLHAYLELEPTAEDKQEVQQQIKLIRQTLAMLN